MVTETRRAGAPEPIWEAAQAAAFVVGGLFLLIGFLSFLPGVTANYGAMAFAGHESGARFLGVFQVSVVHNLVHVAFGVAGVVMARRFRSARMYLFGGGLVYAVLWAYGLLVGSHGSANVVPVNSADNWLHLVAAVGMIALAVVLSHPATARPIEKVTAGRVSGGGPAAGNSRISSGRGGGRQPVRRRSAPRR